MQINENVLRDRVADVPWRETEPGKKWSVGRMEGWSKAGLNSVHFDIEMKGGRWRLAIGYGQDSDVDAARTALLLAHPELEAGIVGDAVGYEHRSPDRVLDLARRCAETMIREGLGRDSTARPARRLRSPVEGWFNRRAATLIELVRRGDWDVVESAYRQLLGDERDDILHLGASRAAAGGGATWREHVVPLCLLRDRAVELAEAGAGETEIAAFLKHHLGVVVITEAERAGVDARWQRTMPEGWAWWGDPLARLRAAGIAL